MLKTQSGRGLGDYILVVWRKISLYLFIRIKLYRKSNCFWVWITNSN